MRAFLNQRSANEKGSRSSALQSMLWLEGILLGAIAALAWAKAPPWVLGLVAVFAGVVLLVLLGAFLYLLCVDRDALRSEEYSLSKMAIERGLMGDNVLGLHDPSLGPPGSGEPARLDGGASR